MQKKKKCGLFLELTVGRASEISRMNTVKQLAPNTALAGKEKSKIPINILNGFTQFELS